MHPAEMLMIESALEQIENSCRALRKYVIMQRKSNLQIPTKDGEIALTDSDEIMSQQIDDQISSMIDRIAGGK
jgi:hypothetical protein